MRLVISKILLKLNYINDQNSFITSVISLLLKNDRSQDINKVSTNNCCSDKHWRYGGK